MVVLMREGARGQCGCLEVLTREGARGQCGCLDEVLTREGARGQCGCLDEGGSERSMWLMREGARESGFLGEPFLNDVLAA